MTVYSLLPACTLLIDGVESLAGTDPIALDDLKVKWGRDDTLSQPAPASCSFRVLDQEGGQSFLNVLHIGSQVDVRADATIFPDPTVSTIPVLRPTWVTRGLVVSGAGTTAVTLRTTLPGPLIATFPPLALSSSPSAWDAVPRTVGGQTWRLTGTVTFPSAFLGWDGWEARITPRAFTSPDGTLQQWLDVPTATVTSSAASAAFDLEIVPPVDVWLGFELRIYPAGPLWQDPSGGLSAGTWSSLGATPTWDALGTFGLSGVAMLAPLGGAGRAGAVFSGRVTDLTASWDEDMQGTMVSVIAQDATAELGSRYVGNEPWPEESLSARFSRIFAYSGAGGLSTVDSTVGSQLVSWQDVDSQPSLKLMQDLAQSCGGALWSATSLVTGPFLRLEDINNRAPMFKLTLTAGVVHIVLATVAGAITLSAADLLLEPVRWEQDTADSSTRVAVSWKEQTTDAESGLPKPTERTELVIDAALEAATGRRRVGVTTMLSEQTDAFDLASALLGRLSRGGWRISGLTWTAAAEETLDAPTLANVMTVLDAATRLGLPILLTDLPDWSPVANAVSVPLYLEGGTFTNKGGAWTFDLVTSSAIAQGRATIAWNAMPVGWLWNTLGSEITWNDLQGVGL